MYINFEYINEQKLYIYTYICISRHQLRFVVSHVFNTRFPHFPYLPWMMILFRHGSGVTSPKAVRKSSINLS